MMAMRIARHALTIFRNFFTHSNTGGFFAPHMLSVEIGLLSEAFQ